MNNQHIWVTAINEGGEFRPYILMRGLECRLEKTYRGDHVAYMAGVEALKRLLNAVPIGAHTESIRLEGGKP